VAQGLVASLGRPGGNTTGLASAMDEIMTKQVDLLITAVPNLTAVAVLTNPLNSSHPIILKTVEAAAQQARIGLLRTKAQNAREIDSALGALTENRVHAIIVPVDGLFFAHRKRIAELAVKNRLPSVFGQREYVQAGGLMSYGDTVHDFFRRAAVYVDKIFKGAKPSDLPIELPRKFKLVINRKTADALGLTIHRDLYILADEVID
jgi:putative ABC transport system substrate-binding protein